MIRIPHKERAEWRKLVTGELDVQLTNFFLRTKVDQIIDDTKKMQLSVEEAIDIVYDMCLELRETRDISADIQAVFGIMDEPVEVPVEEKKPQIPAVEHTNIIKPAETAERHITTQRQNPENKAKKEEANIIEFEKEYLQEASIERKENSLGGKVKSHEIERERLRLASIERRNKERKELLEREKSTQKGSFFKSLFKQ